MFFYLREVCYYPPSKACFCQTHSPSSLVPLLVRSCDSFEVETHSGFGCFHPFHTGFFPSLWIYPCVVFVVGDFQMVSLNDVLFVDDEIISLFFSVLSNSQVPLL